MANRMSRLATLLLAALLLAVAGLQGAAAEKLQLQTAVNAGSPHMTLLQRFADNVKRMSRPGPTTGPASIRPPVCSARP
jgi:TRAP-type C4-dicarboxylate transport system substrate-binding protein